jgi:hypothetical protein
MDIRSRRELNQARENVHSLRKQIGMLRHTYRHDPAAWDLASRGLRQLVRETRRAIRAYEAAQGGKLPAAIQSRNPDSGRLEIPRVLRQLRLSERLGQAELAERLDTHQANISRWEREGYQAYNLRQLERIADALGYDLDITFIRRSEQGDKRR